MRTWIRGAACALALLLLAGCTSADFGQKEAAGSVIGAGLGALAGSQIGSGDTRLIATGAGTLIGAFIGNQAGRSLDRADRAYATRAQYQALEFAPAGSSASWRNPDSGNYGAVTPTRTWQASSGSYCREYSHTVTIDGRPEQVFGTACRDERGNWRATN
jgi:surface antigen